MQSQNGTLFIKQTPFVFLKALFIIEFFFALLPFGLALLLNLTTLYDNSPLADAVSYNLFSIIALTTLQVLIISFAFILWYVPAYQIDEEKIVHLGHNLMNDKEVARIQTVLKTAVSLGPIGKRFNYGNVILILANQTRPVKIKNVANPQQLARLIEAMGGKVTAEPARTFNWPDKPVPQLIAEGESQHLEFKASFLWDYHRNIANKDLHIPVLKNVAAFMNTNGGIILVGVSDDGEILGLEPDFKMMKKKDRDGWENTFNNVFNRLIGPEYRQYLAIIFETIDEKVISILAVRPSPEPVYLNVNGKEDFYIKTGNASQSLSVRQANNYIQSHFKK